MVSYEELIYCFTDFYLKSAMECSICKENYTMADDTEFLDDYMKFFGSLLIAIEKDDSLSIEDVKATLLNRKNRELVEFQSFLRHEVTKQALEKVEKSLKHDLTSSYDDGMYMEKINEIFHKVFDEGCSSVKESPVKLLRYVRAKEEMMQERN